MAYSASVRIGRNYHGFRDTTFHQRSSAKIRFNHERRGSDRHLFSHRIGHDCTHRHCIFPGFYDEPIQCHGLLAAIGFVDRP
jgi:hypothetical protein